MAFRGTCFWKLGNVISKQVPYDCFTSTGTP